MSDCYCKLCIVRTFQSLEVKCNCLRAFLLFEKSDLWLQRVLLWSVLVNGICLTLEVHLVS